MTYMHTYIHVYIHQVEPENRTSKDQIYMRGMMTMDLSYVECIDMMCYFGERRSMWDTNYKVNMCACMYVWMYV